MRTLPCPRCGNPQTLGTFCKSCLRELSPLIASVRSGKLIFCIHCTRIQQQGTWRTIDLHKALKASLSHMLVPAEHARIRSMTFEEPDIERKPGIKKTSLLTVHVRGRNEEAVEEYDEDYEVPLAYEVTVCPACRKSGTSYYEGILQLRNEREAAREVIRTYLEENRSRGVHLAKRVEVGSGTDYYLSSNRAVGHLARKLHSLFGGTLKVNAQHFSEDKQKGKILYRTNALLEIPDYAKGDVILREEKYLYVTGIAHTVAAEDVREGREVRFPYVPGESRVLPIAKAQIVALHPLTVLHPITFQQVSPLVSKYAPSDLEVDMQVSVALDGDVLVLVAQTLPRSVPKNRRRRLSQKRKE